MLERDEYLEYRLLIFKDDISCKYWLEKISLYLKSNLKSDFHRRINSRIGL